MNLGLDVAMIYGTQASINTQVYVKENEAKLIFL